MAKKSDTPKRGRPAKFAGAELKYVVALLAANGPTITQKILTEAEKRFGKKTEFGSQRDRKVFPKPLKSLALLTLCRIGQAHGLEFKRGRPNPIEGEKAVKRAVALVKELGASGAAAKLAGEGVVVSIPTLCKMARDAGVSLKRGRRVTAEAA